MAASKPTSQLSQQNHILRYTQPSLRDLSCRSGFFPSRRWTLSLSDCLPGSITQEFGVWLGEVSLFGSRTHPVLYLLRTHFLRPYLNMFRGEPAISELDWPFTPTLSHPSGFQPTTVRASTACYGGFTLLKGRSPRLRVYGHVPGRPIQTRFRSASGPEGLKLHVTSNSLRHNAKGTPSADNGPKPAAASDRL